VADEAPTFWSIMGLLLDPVCSVIFPILEVVRGILLRFEYTENHMSRTPRACFVKQLLIFVCILYSTIFAGDSADQVTMNLAGSDSREWVFAKMEMFMSSEHKCRKGESYRFRTDHQVIITTCLDGHIQTQNEHWSIEEGDDPETHIRIGDAAYVVKFWSSRRGRFMMLRIKPATKVEPTRDKVFRLEED
jgi:hypothetical protein